jgi:GH35 family endo-1,4-beta-xylanase
MPQGAKRTDWFFAHDGRHGLNGLPKLPCKHQHPSHIEAILCARRRNLSYTCQVVNEAAQDDQRVP